MRFLPEVASRRRADEPNYVRSYVFARFAIGLLGIALPPALVLIEPALFDGLPAPRGSLSAYYYSGVRELFVGGLWAIGVFLLVYKFLDFTWEGLLSSLAGVAAVFVAVFPTELPGAGVDPTPLQALFGEGFVAGVHYGSAIAFIGLLAPITIIFGRDEGRRDPRLGARFSPRFWRAFHWTCSFLILVGAALAAYAGLTGGPDKGVLFGEWLAVWAFGASWLMKGAELDTLLGRS
jgi:hypothetical protein